MPSPWPATATGRTAAGPRRVVTGQQAAGEAAGGRPGPVYPGGQTAPAAPDPSTVGFRLGLDVVGVSRPHEFGPLNSPYAAELTVKQRFFFSLKMHPKATILFAPFSLPPKKDFSCSGLPAVCEVVSRQVSTVNLQ